VTTISRLGHTSPQLSSRQVASERNYSQSVASEKNPSKLVRIWKNSGLEIPSHVTALFVSHVIALFFGHVTPLFPVI
jgi:hypothetical protein